MTEPLPVRAPVIVLLVAVLATGAGIWGTTQIEPQVDFVDTVPDHPGLQPYRNLLDELDGVRFVAVYQAHDRGFGPNLRDDAGFGALVDEQLEFSAALHARFPAGTFSHELSAAEGMKAGNYMLEKIATAGNPRPESYSVPDDELRYNLVRDQILGDGTIDDVLAQDGSSALMLYFFATKDSLEARALTGEVAAFIDDWGEQTEKHPATREHAPSGLLWASYATDSINQNEMQRLAPWAAVGVAISLLWLVRRPSNVLIATLSLGMALLWTYGIMGFAGWPISFLTFLLAPIVIGIGIDYAVHVLHRYEEERDQDAPRHHALSTAVRYTGRAVGVAAATTAAGLAVLLLVPNPLFAQIGGVAALGVGLGFVAALTVTPALRALIPDSGRRGRKDRVGVAVAHLAQRIYRLPWLAVLAVALVTAGAGWVAAEFTVIESGSAENEFPQDDPIIVLQHRIEAEYGAFQRAYLVVQGDITEPHILIAMHEAIDNAATLPLFREATAVTELILANEATDEGAVDILEAAINDATGQTQTDAERLPQTRAEAREALDALYADPLWRTIAPFTISDDYRLAIVSITIDPWQDQDQLRDFVDALRGQADVLQAAVGQDGQVAAAGSPVNRVELVQQTPVNVMIATIGATAAVFAVLMAAWWRRGLEGLTGATVAASIVGVGSVWLSATVPLLDSWYDLIGSPNNAVLSDMFLVAFAVTVAVGVDDLVHLMHRYWEERDRGSNREKARRVAFTQAGRAITGTTITTFIAFALMIDIYFLQSKNLAILTAAGVVFAYTLTLLLAPLAMRDKRPAA